MNSQKNENKSQPEFSDFEHLTLADYVDQDPRPTFVLDLRSNVDGINSVLPIAFTNKAYRAANVTLEYNIRQALGSTPSGVVDFPTTAFIAWLKRSQLSGFFQYQDHAWTATSLFSRWRIVTGEFVGNSNEETGVGQEKKPRRDPENGKSEPTSSVASDTNLTKRRKSGHSKPGPLDVLRFSDSASREHCHFVQDFDWSQTPLGPMQDWSPTTANTIIYMLCNPDPCVIFWGRERTIVYNEPYVSLIGALHPAALGASAKVHFGEFWPPFERLVQDIDQSGCPTKQDTYSSVLDRSGVLEELWFRGTFTPILNHDGQVIGIFNHVVEITKEVISSRRMGTLLKVTEETSTMIEPDRLWQGILSSMQTCAADLPFFAIYSTGRESYDSELAGITSATVTASSDWHLEAMAGFPQAHPAIPSTLSLQQNTGLAPALRLLLASSAGRPLMVRKMDNHLPIELFHIQTDRGQGVDISGFVLCSLSPLSGKNTVFLAFAIPAEQRYDEEYQQFLSLLSHRIEDMVTSAFLLQKERIRTRQAVAEAENQQEWLSEQLIRQTREAQASEFRFYKFAEHAPVAVYIIGPEGDVRFGNKAWYDLLGSSPDDKSLLPWRRHIHPDDLGIVDLHWKRMQTGKQQSSVEFRVIKNISGDTSNTSISYLKATAFPERDEDGNMKSVTGIMTDYSAQKSQELAVADRLAEALEAKRAQENFMDMVSHEMRNPLSAMLQCAEEVSQTLSSVSKEASTGKVLADRLATMTEAVDTIQWCGRHQRQIIDDVLTISKLDSDLLTLAPVETLPSDVIKQVLKMFASEASAADIQISSSISSGSKHQFCVFDASRVLQILINLVSNAIKFTKGRPVRKLELSVSTSIEEPQVTGTKFASSDRQRRQWPTAANPTDVRYIFFTVKDTGPGLTTAEMESLFARFRQASPRTHAQYGGSGLGLFISRELSEMHGGKIGLNSKVGMGSTFSFYVKSHIATDRTDDTTHMLASNGEDEVVVTPIKTNKANVSSDVAQSPLGTTLLIVEDNLVNQKVLVRQITKLGFQTVTANHGQEALTIVENSTWWHDKKPGAVDISVILCDLEMPVMDGMTCIRHIRQWQADGLLKVHVPVIAVTGNARAEQVQAAREAGFDDVICKPYSVPDLVPMISRLTNR